VKVNDSLRTEIGWSFVGAGASFTSGTWKTFGAAVVEVCSTAGSKEVEAAFLDDLHEAKATPMTNTKNTILFIVSVFIFKAKLLNLQ